MSETQIEFEESKSSQKEVYCASLIFVSKFIDIPQTYFPVNQILLLVEAESFESGEEKALNEAKLYEDYSGNYSIDEIPFHLVFKGIREILKRPDMKVESFGIYEGEVWDNAYLLRSMDDVEAFARGDAVPGVLGSIRSSVEDGRYERDLLKKNAT